MCLKNNNIIWTIIGIIVFIVLLIFILSPLTSCGNKMLIDTRYTYNVAYITIGDERKLGYKVKVVSAEKK